MSWEIVIVVGGLTGLTTGLAIELRRIRRRLARIERAIEWASPALGRRLDETGSHVSVPDKWDEDLTEPLS